MHVEVFSVRGTDNLSYLLVDGRAAVLVDPGYEAGEVLSRLEERELVLEYVVLTHHHPDHTSSVGWVINVTGAVPVASRYCLGKLDINGNSVDDGDVLRLKDTILEFILTPGHTPGSICILADGRYLFTGDTLFIDDCGRCDLEDGSLEDMFASLQRIKELPDEVEVFPGHDYGPHPRDTMAAQKRTNPTLRAENIQELSGI